jgi:hypothetical protein
MNALCDNTCKCSVRLDAALAVLELSTARIKNLIAVGGSDDAVESACTSLRLSTTKFLAAVAECRDVRRAESHSTIDGLRQLTCDSYSSSRPGSVPASSGELVHTCQ